MDNTRGLIAGVRKDLMREDVEEQFRKNRNDTDQIIERALEAEDKVNNAKGMNLWSVTKRIMSAYRQLRKIRNAGETERSCVGETQMIYYLFKYWKGGSYRGFFPRKICKLFCL